MWSALVVGGVLWALLLQAVARYRIGAPDLSLLYAPLSLGRLRARVPLGALLYETPHVPWFGRGRLGWTQALPAHLWCDAGIVFACMAMLTSLVILCVTCVQVTLRLWAAYAPPARLGKRSLDEPAPLWITPLWSLSLSSSDLFVLLCVVAVSQLVHEAGHVLAALLHHVRPRRWGLVLAFPCIVMAHVTFPDLTSLSVRKQLRIVAAGVWQNAVTLAAWAALTALAAGVWVDAGGWRVTGCDDAALASYLRHDATMVAINDVSVDTMPPQQRTLWWHRLQNDALPREPGWCLPSSLWDKADASCCVSPENERGCFVDAHRATKCLDVLSTFAPDRARCDESCEGVCVRVDPSHPLVRLHLQQSDGSVDDLVLQGTASSLAAHVRVSPYRLVAPLRALLHHRLADMLTDILRTVSRFMYMVQGSMVLVNMLPIVGLDGGHMAELGLGLLWPSATMPLYTPGTSSPHTPRRC
ncbi:S2P endopeptidase [Malassezia nana]|uniref:Endopeptidase S2P n=1 Tax=Malassezia nana TaxID=180528 RepID=A0AAF0EGR6_9BASI|nr:S2P endopeptidase [Malassezia nana]